MGFPLGLINKKSGVALSKKNDPILSVEAKASRMDRISSLEEIDQLNNKLGLQICSILDVFFAIFSCCDDNMIQTFLWRNTKIIDFNKKI